MPTAHNKGVKLSVATAADAADPLIAGVAGKVIILEHVWLGAGAALVEQTTGGATTLVTTLPANNFLSWQNLGLRQLEAGADIDLTGSGADATVWYRMVDA